jgi:outer membrane protein assembly factor BamB
MVNDEGIVSCMDAKTGKQIWQERIKQFGGCYASPVSAEGRIYACDTECATAVFAASREYKLLAMNKLDAGCTASPAIAGDALFIRTKTHLYCIGN